MKEHQEHKTIYFNNLLPEVDEIKESLSEIKKNIESFNSKINIIIKQLLNVTSYYIFIEFKIKYLNIYKNNIFLIYE